MHLNSRPSSLARAAHSEGALMLFMLLPLGFAYDATASSSECDLLADALNEKRMRDLAQTWVRMGMWM